MKLSPVIYYYMRKLLFFNQKVYSKHIWRTIAPQHIDLLKIVGQSHESLLLLLSESENRIEKSCFYQALLLFKNSV